MSHSKDEQLKQHNDSIKHYFGHTHWPWSWQKYTNCNARGRRSWRSIERSCCGYSLLNIHKWSMRTCALVKIFIVCCARIVLVSCPARSRLPARNGLVNEVEFLGLITSLVPSPPPQLSSLAVRITQRRPVKIITWCMPLSTSRMLVCKFCSLVPR